jgi:ribosomal protein S18 acetylase RimI-like enzyme
VRLDPMTDGEYETYLATVVVQYAESHVKAGKWTEAESRERSAAEYAKLLPDGVGTAGHHLYTIRDGDSHVGTLWFAEQDEGRTAYLYDIRIDAELRGSGYGRAVMGLFEDTARAMGMSNVRLHVFAHNSVARGLYQRLGYVERNVIMSKRLD